jgi:hypothetical protein
VANLPFLLLSLLLHASVLTWYVLHRPALARNADAPVISIQLVASRPPNPSRPRPPRRPTPPVTHGEPIIQGPMPTTRDAAPTMAQAADVMAAPFADAHRPPHAGRKPPCEALDAGRGDLADPCMPGGPLLAFDLDRERGGRELAFQTQRRSDMRRYRNAAGGEHYPGLNCAIFQMKAFHLCNQKGVDPPRLFGGKLKPSPGGIAFDP